MTKKVGEREESVTNIELQNGVDAGINLRILHSNLVPIYEEHSARLERGVPLSIWQDMNEFEKALIIAQRRIAKRIRDLQTEAEVQKAKRDAKKR